MHVLCHLWAEATVPGAVDEHGPLKIFLVSGDGTISTVSDSATLNRDMPNMFWAWEDIDSAGGFQGLLRCLEDRDSLVPLDPDWDPVEDEIEEEDRNRASWAIMRDDQRMVTIPWIAFEWEGEYSIELLAITRDYYEYLYSEFRNQQGLGLKLHSNINGGLGIFGAISRYSMTIFMERTTPR